MKFEDNTKKIGMEELMPKLVGLVLSQIELLSLAACWFMCTTWMTALPPPSSSNIGLELLQQANKGTLWAC
jgi:hypothetical protein